MNKIINFFEDLNLTGYFNLPSVYEILHPQPRHFNCRCVFKEIEI